MMDPSVHTPSQSSNVAHRIPGCLEKHQSPCRVHHVPSHEPTPTPEPRLHPTTRALSVNNFQYVLDANYVPVPGSDIEVPPADP